MRPEIRTFFESKTQVGSSDVISIGEPERTYQLSVKGTGAVSAGVTVYGSQSEAGPWEKLCTMSASGTAQASESALTVRQWIFTKATLDTLTGTGASATLKVGC